MVSPELSRYRLQMSEANLSGHNNKPVQEIVFDDALDNSCLLLFVSFQLQLVTSCIWRLQI